LANAEHGKKKAWFFLSYHFNGLRQLTDGTSMFRRTSAHVRKGFMQRYGDAEQRSIRTKDANIIQGICETPYSYAPPSGTLAAFTMIAVMSRGAHLKDSLRLGLPLVLAQLALMSQGLVDALLAGRLGAEVLAAVAVGTAVWGFALVVTIGLQAALSPVISQLRGAQDWDEIPRVLRQGLWTTLLASAFAITVILLAPSAFAAIGVDPEIALGARDFLRGVIYGAPALALFTGLRSYCEAMGYSKPSLYFAVLGLTCLVPIGYVLMYGALGFPQWRAFGAGLATSIVNWIQALVLLWYIHRHPILGASGRALALAKPNPEIIAKLLKLGFPIALGWAMEAGLFQACALLVARFGESWTAAHQAAINFASMTFMVPLGLSMAVAVRVGHARGAGEPINVRRAASVGLALGLGTQLCSCFLMALAAVPIAGLYLPNDPLVAAMAAKLLILAAVFQFPDGIQVICAGALRGLKDTLVPSMMTIVAYWMIAFPLGYWLCFKRGLEVPGLWYGFITGLSVAAVLLGSRLWFRLRALE
jgi:MATE family multidrug resistance protein